MKMKNEEINDDNEHQEHRDNADTDEAADADKPIERNETMLDDTET